MKEPRLRELPGKSRLALGFFNSLIRRIECTKPLAGENITLEEKDDGIVISAEAGGLGGTTVTANVVTLNVCSNGTHANIFIYSATAYTATPLNLVIAEEPSP